MLMYRAGHEDEEWEVDVAETCDCCHRDLLEETDHNEGDPYWILEDEDDEHHVVCRDCLGERYAIQSHGVTCDVCGRYIEPEDEEYVAEPYYICRDVDGEHHIVCEDCLGTRYGMVG